MHPILNRRAILFALSAVTLAACVPIVDGSRTPSLDDVISRNLAARGGAPALDRVESVAVDIEIVEGGQTLKGHYAATVTGLVRIDIYADGKPVFSEGVDDAGAWNWRPGGPPKPSVDAGRAALLDGAESHLFGWHRFAGRGHKLALMPLERIEGIPFQIVRVTLRTGQTTYFYVDPNSWLAVRKRDERAYHPDVDLAKQKVETRFSDFRAVDGVIAPHLDEDFDLGTGKLLATHRVLDRKINPRLPPAHFDRQRRAPATF